MSILMEKGAFIILLKLWEAPCSFNQLLHWCEKGKKSNDRIDYYLYVATLRKKLKLLEEQGYLIREVLKKRQDGKFTKYSLTNDGKMVLNQVNQSIQIMNSKEKDEKFQKKDLDVVWEKDIIIILSLFWNDSTNQGKNFNSILHFCNENKKRLYSSATLSRKLRFLIKKNVLSHEFLDKWKDNCYSIYSLTDSGKLIALQIKKLLSKKEKIKNERASQIESSQITNQESKEEINEIQSEKYQEVDTEDNEKNISKEQEIIKLFENIFVNKLIELSDGLSSSGFSVEMANDETIESVIEKGNLEIDQENKNLLKAEMYQYIKNNYSAHNVWDWEWNWNNLGQKLLELVDKYL